MQTGARRIHGDIGHAWGASDNAEASDSLREGAGEASVPSQDTTQVEHEPYGALNLDQPSDESAAPSTAKDQPKFVNMHMLPLAFLAEVAASDTGASNWSADPWAEHDSQANKEWQPVSAQTSAFKAPPTGFMEALGNQEPEAVKPEQLFLDGGISTVARPRSSNAKLIGKKGEDASQSFVIATQDGSEITVGRTPVNTIVLKDSSVSREHARLVAKDGGFIVFDLQSGNGTFVNKKRLTKQQKVKHGDTISFGRALFKLEIKAPGAPAEDHGLPAPTLGQRIMYSRFMVAALMTLIMVVGTVSTAVWLLSRSAKQQDVATVSDATFLVFDKGLQAYKARDWDLAERHFKAVLQLEPRHLKSEKFIGAILEERAALAHLEAGRRSHEAGDAQGALRSLQQALNSSYRDEARALLNTIEIDQAMQVGSAQPDAEQKAAKPSSPPPTQAAAATRPSPAAPEPSKRPDASSASPVAPKASPTAAAEPSSSKTNDIDEARALFASGVFDKALEKLGSRSSKEAQALSALISEFSDVYVQGMEEFRAKRSTEAIQLLLQARSLAIKVAGPDASIVKQIASSLANMHYLEGIQAYLSNDFAEAYKSFQTALQYDRKHEAASAKLRDIALKARDTLREGDRLAAADKDQARKKWKTVLQLVPPGDPLYKEATKRLEQR